MFIDDNPGNAAAARALGMHGVHFRSPEFLRTELGVLGSPSAATHSARRGGEGVA